MESDGDVDENAEHETVIISGDLEEDYDNPTHLTVVQAQEIISGVGHSGRELGLNQSSTKSKYYKQTYRTAWENMPDFKGWLRGVNGEPTRAFCIYCQKTLHAHRLSLLKHTCTMRHQKAAQIHQARKNHQAKKFEILVQNTTSEGDHIDEQAEEEQMMEDESFLTEEVEEHIEEEEEDTVHITRYKHEQGHKSNPYLVTKVSTHATAPISTLVMDTAKGTSIQGLQVSLYKLIEGRWTYINEGTTNLDGRFWNFIERKDFSAGRYKLHYDVDRYFESKKMETIYPFVEIVFDVPSVTDRFHIPLLLSPFGYSTYKG